jgi:hypothetical protein
LSWNQKLQIQAALQVFEKDEMTTYGKELGTGMGWKWKILNGMDADDSAFTWRLQFEKFVKLGLEEFFVRELKLVFGDEGG